MFKSYLLSNVFRKFWVQTWSISMFAFNHYHAASPQKCTYQSIQLRQHHHQHTVNAVAITEWMNLSENHCWHWNVFVEINRQLFAVFSSVSFFFSRIDWEHGRKCVLVKFYFTVPTFISLWNHERIRETFGVMIVADSIVYNNGYMCMHIRMCVSLFLPLSSIHTSKYPIVLLFSI